MKNIIKFRNIGNFKDESIMGKNGKLTKNIWILFKSYNFCTKFVLV